MPEDQSPTGSGSGGAPDGASGSGPVLSRQDLHRRSKGRGGSRAWSYTIGTLALVVAGVVVAAMATRGGPVDAGRVAAATTSTAPNPPCPLTGAPAHGATVPARPALGIKIGNYPDDRPSAGLNQADIVFEEPVEGAITRLVAMFQCQGAPLVGDIRSARQPDAGILSQFFHPLFVHAGGIAPVIGLLQSSPVIDKNLYSSGNGSAIIQQPGRVPPYSTFVNTATLWALAPSDTSPPGPVFQYSASPPEGSVPGSGSSVHIPFSSSSDVTWQWNPSTGSYRRFYAGQPDRLLDGSQTAAADVVVMTVPTATGSWVENSEGGHEVDVTATGSGPLVVLRNGVAVSGTWTRPTLTVPAALTTAAGAPITLQPGNSWVELVPAGIPVTTSAGPAPAAPAH